MLAVLIVFLNISSLLQAEQFRDPHVDQEILESIESFYYNSEQFDTSEYELKVGGTLMVVSWQHFSGT